MIIFRIAEIMTRYKVTVADLANELEIQPNTVSQWRVGKSKPSIDKLNRIMNAIEDIGDSQQLELFPLNINDILSWKTEKQQKAN
ncbi:XRE family transcriptional regulator [Leptolyngbyaceae cyanobacterium CCMR0082]|uniref:XRE family transcriptional regulator n=1 Tax=Adonisia turfae CCMR0082 TaxID=2304604 RepID=A0A6M0SA74_9CYAN|nr:helix-turn-helix transcriptional regulator [Adonisia turfae]NEZ64632.1 XRE family transcriptional regulator [Adonisia turfae CCMR0082]